tara:strand:- start:6826 stop:7095 length:270 start_codon:yes stop_codon:yes gene_type:complete
MVWTQEEETAYLKSPYKKYSIGIPYIVWVDVDAKDEDEATDLACNAEFDLTVKVGKNEPRVNVVDHAELQEYVDPMVYCEDDGTYSPTK